MRTSSWEPPQEYIGRKYFCNFFQQYIFSHLTMDSFIETPNKQSIHELSALNINEQELHKPKLETKLQLKEATPTAKLDLYPSSTPSLPSKGNAKLPQTMAEKPASPSHSSSHSAKPSQIRPRTR